MEITLSGDHGDLVIRDPVLVERWKLVKFGLFTCCLCTTSLVLSIMTPKWYGLPLALINLGLLFVNVRWLLHLIGVLGVRLFVAGTLQHPIANPNSSFYKRGES